MTNAQRAYTKQYVTVDQSPAQARSERGYTVYLVTHNPLMATYRRKVITTAPSLREAEIIAQGYTARGDLEFKNKYGGLD